MEQSTPNAGTLDEVFDERELPRAQSWLYDTIQGFVDEEIEVTVRTARTEAGAVFNVRVASRDVGKVIGKSGRMARNLRGVLLARGRKWGAVYILNIEQDAERSAAVEVLEELARAS